MCVQGPHGGCAGGLYPLDDGSFWGPGKIGNLNDPCKNRKTVWHGETILSVSCYPVSDDCDIAAAICACNKENVKDPPGYHLGISDCYHYPYILFDCACRKVPSYKRNDCMRVITDKLGG